MAGIRDYNFVVGPETSTLPTVSTPTVDTDLITKVYADDIYARRASFYDSQANNAAVKAIDAADRFEGQIVLNQSNDSLYMFDAGSTAVDDGDTVLQPTVGTGRWLKITSGGGGGGGGGSLTNVPAGEDINAADTPAACFLWEKPYLDVTTSNQFIDLNEGAGDLLVTVPAQRYLFDTEANRLEFTTAVKTALDAAGTLTYTVTFSGTTRKLTIAGSANFSLKWKTGSKGSDNTDTHIGTLLGYSDAADDLTAGSFVADNTIDGTLSYGLFAFKCDAGYIERSKPYFGIIEDGAAKYAEVDFKFSQQIDGFTGLTEADELYTAHAGIIIDSTNNKLDFDEAGSNFTATITSGTYHHPYETLLTVLKTQMEAVNGAPTYTWTYNSDDDKFTVVGSSAFAMEFLTGANNATSIDTSLGFTHTDHATNTTHTSDNALGLRGQIVNAQSPRLTSQSVFAGFARLSTDVFAKRAEGTEYIEVLNSPNTWLTDAIDYDAGSDVELMDQHENENGVGVRLFLKTGSPAEWRMQYKTGHGAAWVVAATTISVKVSGSIAYTIGGTETTRPRCFVDENGKGVIAVIRQNSGTADFEVYAYHSTDLNTWTSSGSNPIVANAGVNWRVGGLYIRQTKAALLVNRGDSASSQIAISTDTGSGYTTWANTGVSGTNYSVSRPSGILIQYFPAESGVNKWRLVSYGQDGANAKLKYMKGDGTGSTDLTSFSTNSAYMAACLDSAGTGNRILAFGLRGGSDEFLHIGYTNETYNGGTLTWTDNSLTNYNTSGFNLGTGSGQHNGYNTADYDNLMLMQHKKAVLVANTALFVTQVRANAGSAEALYLWKSFNVTGNVWTNSNIGDLVGREHEMVLHYLPGAGGAVCVWKLGSTTVGNTETTGQIYSRFIEIGASTVNLHTTTQVDGGEPLAGFQGRLMISGTPDSANISWEKTSTYEILSNNKFV